MPKSVYPESVSSSSSRELNAILNKLLRQDAQILRDLLVSGADQATVQAKKEDLLQEIFNFLAMSLGLPPRKFDFAALTRKMDTMSYKIAKLQGYIYDHLEVDEFAALHLEGAHNLPLSQLADSYD
ncbi:aminopeptidase [Streptococcus pneumoniae]|nr:aminopeptidase [Streptococcus pneumoniae]